MKRLAAIVSMFARRLFGESEYWRLYRAAAVHQPVLRHDPALAAVKPSEGE